MKSHAYFGMVLGCLLPIVACGHSFKNGAPAVVRLAAEDCVESARMHGDSKTETSCAKASELAPLLDLILAARKNAGVDAGIDAHAD